MRDGGSASWSLPMAERRELRMVGRADDDVRPREVAGGPARSSPSANPLGSKHAPGGTTPVPGQSGGPAAALPGLGGIGKVAGPPWRLRE